MVRVLDLVWGLAGLGVLFAPWALKAAAADTIPGPVPAELVRVIDGDTFEVRARIWPGQTVETRVRLAGIDAPEIGGRALCEQERAKGAEAKAFAEALLKDTKITLSQIRPDKYGGRVVARIALGDGTDLSAALLEAGHAAAPSDKKDRWCTA